MMGAATNKWYQYLMQVGWGGGNSSKKFNQIFTNIYCDQADSLQ